MFGTKRKMVVTQQQSGDIDVLRYVGSHACSEGDHRQDESVRKSLQDLVDQGRGHYLLVDVRELRVTYGSGIHDILGSWEPVTGHRRGWLSGHGRGRLAILWKRPTGRHAGHMVACRWLFLAEHTSAGPPLFFDEERNALAFLRSEAVNPPDA